MEQAIASDQIKNKGNMCTSLVAHAKCLLQCTKGIFYNTSNCLCFCYKTSQGCYDLVCGASSTMTVGEGAFMN